MNPIVFRKTFNLNNLIHSCNDPTIAFSKMYLLFQSCLFVCLNVKLSRSFLENTPVLFYFEIVVETFLCLTR